MRTQQQHRPRRRARRVLLTALAVTLVALFFGLPASAAELDGNPYATYSKEQNILSTPQRPTFEVDRVIGGLELGVDDFEEPNDLVTDPDGNVYILDSGNGRIVVLHPDLSLSGILDRFEYQGSVLDFTNAQGMFISADRELLIADTDNKRVIVSTLDQHGQGNPDAAGKRRDSADFQYRPRAVVKDQKGFTYVLSDGSYYGALVYSRDNAFFGFSGPTWRRPTCSAMSPA